MVAFSKCATTTQEALDGKTVSQSTIHLALQNYHEQKHDEAVNRLLDALRQRIDDEAPEPFADTPKSKP